MADLGSRSASLSLCIAQAIPSVSQVWHLADTYSSDARNGPFSRVFGDALGIRREERKRTLLLFGDHTYSGGVEGVSTGGEQSGALAALARRGRAEPTALPLHTLTFGTYR